MSRLRVVSSQENPDTNTGGLLEHISRKTIAAGAAGVLALSGAVAAIYPSSGEIKSVGKQLANPSGQVETATPQPTPEFKPELPTPDQGVHVQ